MKRRLIKFRRTKSRKFHKKTGIIKYLKPNDTFRYGCFIYTVIEADDSSSIKID